MPDYIETINKLSLDIRAGNIARGFWDDLVQAEMLGPDFAGRSLNVEKLALIGTEVAEAIEEIRSGRKVTETYYMYLDGEHEAPDKFDLNGKLRKPEGVPSEIADVIIRALDFAGFHNIDIGQAIADKLAYNSTRAFKHGRVM